MPSLTQGPYAIGYDWDENGGVFAVVDMEGRILTSLRVPPTDKGLAKVLAAIEPYRDEDGQLPPLAVEATRRPILNALAAAGVVVWMSNSDALPAFRKQFRTNAKSKSDRADAGLLAHRLLQFPRGHRPMTELNDFQLTVSGLSRLDVELGRLIVDQANRLRSILAEFNPAILRVFPATRLGKTKVASQYLIEVPTLTEGRALSEDDISLVLRTVGNGTRNRQQAKALKEAYSEGFLSYDPQLDAAIAPVIVAHARQLLNLLHIRDETQAELKPRVKAHPVSTLIAHATGLGEMNLPLLLSEIGDDPRRFGSARAFQAFLAVIPYTAQSGSGQRDSRRRTKGNKAHKAMWDWASAAVLHQPGAKYYYWQRRSHGDYHGTAIRKVAERLASGLWHCWSTGNVWDDEQVWREPLVDVDEFVASVKQRNEERRRTKPVNHGVRNKKSAA